jgi:iron complex outermembrane receptor protein
MKQSPTRVLAIAWLSLLAASPLAADAPSGGVELQPIAVTGTRLRNDYAEGAFPLAVFDREAIAKSGQTSLGDFLQELPFLSGSPLNTSSSARGEGGGMSRGISTVELRGLGPERTLVLVNGRRFVPGGNGASGVVDVSMIPLAMVERVEIFKSGASIEYGADAVAGVINIITRGDADGLDLQALGSITSEGDAERYVLGATYGRRSERGRFVIGAEYSDQPALGKGERDWSYEALSVTGPDNEVIPFGSSAPPQGNHGTSLGRMILRDGAAGTSIDDFRRFTSADRYNFNPSEDLLQASERLSLFAEGRFEVAPAINFFGEAFYHQRDSGAQLASLPFFTNREVDVAVSADNIYNPFGERIADARRRLVEAGPRSFIQANQAWRFVLGADGTLVESWAWDASVNLGRNETDQVQTGDLFDSQLRLALGPSFFDASGKPVCGTPLAPIAGCVPLNLFGPVGSITPEMLAFVGTDLHDTGYNDQKVVSANLSGNPWTLPTGAVGLAFGYEYRDESAADVPDPETLAGNTTGSARGITRGDFQSHEAYAEMGIPLLTDAAMARQLSLDLGARWVNFSSFDTEWVSEIALRYRPVDDWQFRLSYTEAFRAPNVLELYGGVAQSNPIVEDPCADFSQLSPEEINRCVAQGVPPDGSFDQNGQETPVTGGGNPNLGPELADTWNLGLTYAPESLPGLRISVDYFSVDIDNGIAALGANSILEQCIATGIAEYCDRITRNEEGGITQVTAELQNLATESARGVDLDTQLAHSGFGGDFSHRLLLSYLGERDIVAFAGAEPIGNAGEYVMGSIGAIPRWRGQYSLEWGHGAWRFGYQAQWIGSMEEHGGELYPGTVNHIPGRIYQDVFAGYDFSGAFSVTGGVDNVSNEDPPFFVNADEANTDVSSYRLYGTTFWLRLNLHL